MRRFDVYVHDSAFDDLEQILEFKLELSDTNSGAIRFRDSILSAIDDLHSLPFASKPLIRGYRAKVVLGHYLIFEVDEANLKVYVSQIIDPAQHTKAAPFL